MTAAIGPGLTRVPCAISGAWGEKWSRLVWDGTARCELPFVLLLLGALGGVSCWSKSAPSDSNNPLAISFDPIPNRGTQSQLYLTAGHARLSDFIVDFRPAHRADLRDHVEGVTGTPIPFLSSTSPGLPTFIVLFLAKQDVKVRRNRVWGLKPRLIDEVSPAWRSILARGRAGVLGEDFLG